MINRTPVRDRLGALGWRRGSQYRRSRVMPVEGRASVQDKRNKRCGTGRLGNLTTPKRVQKLQKALHAKAKAEAGYRFYALYDNLSREDILAHAYAQCRSNKSLPLRRQGAHRE